MTVHAISSPSPEPITFTPVPDEALPPVGRGRRVRWLVLIAAVMAAFWAGRFSAPESVIGTRPTLDTTLAWMFDAALGHPGATSEGAAVAAALTDITVERIDVVDPVLGPLLVVISHRDGMMVYEIAVERRTLDWTVTASRLTSDRAISQAGS